MSYERPAELITLARRKLFTLHLKQKEAVTVEETLCNDIECTANETDSIDEASLPSLTQCEEKKEETGNACQLVSAKLVTKSSQDFVLILSFSRIIADYWSSCLFVHQLVDMYGKLEKSPTYKPSMAALRQAKLRQDTFKSFESIRTRGSSRGSFRALTKRPLPPSPLISKELKPSVNALVSFLQVAMREKEILIIKSKERLYNFWQNSITAILKRTRGPPRVKVIPPLRIPTGHREVTRPENHPMTSRLRPLTGRARPITARKISIDQSLTGPSSGTQYIKVKKKDKMIDTKRSL